MPTPSKARAAEKPAIGFARVRHALMTRGNALTDINPQRLGAAIDAYRHGFIAAMARITENIGSRDDTWVIAEEKYKASVARCAWDVVPLEGHEKDPEALRQAESIRTVYAGITATHVFKSDVKGGIRKLIKQMLDARSLGWSIHEITVSYTGGKPQLTLTQAPLWWFESTTGRLRYLETNYGTYGQPLMPGRWLVHGGAGIGIACSIAAVFKRLSLEDWLIWSERFGQPGIHGITSAMPDSPEWEQAVEALRAYSADWQVLTGEGVRFEPIAAGNAGAIPYPKLVERMDRAIAALWRGADLSTLSAGTGEGSGASLQGEEADMIEQDACAEVSETLHNTVDRLIVDLTEGPGAPLLATFVLTPNSRPDITREIAIDTHLVNLGAKLSLRDALARYGRTEADPSDTDDRALISQAALMQGAMPPQGTMPTQGAMTAFCNSADPSAMASVSDLAKALQDDLSPAADAVRELLANPTPAAARALLARLPALLPGDPEMAAVIESTVAETFADRLAEGTGETDLANSECRAKDPSKCPYHGGKQADDIGEYEAEKRGINPDSAEVQNAEIGKGKAALKRCLEEKTDVYDAIARSDLGTISFIYNFEDRGIEHFIHRKETLDHLCETLIRGKLGGLYQGGEKRNITYGGYTAVLRLDRDGKKETWVLTAFGPKDSKGDREKAKKEGSPR